MILNMNNWRVQRPVSNFLAFSGENNTENLYIIPSLMEDYVYTIDVRNEGQTAFIPLTKAERGGKDVLHVLLTSGQIGPAGEAQMQIVGRREDGTVVKKSNVFAVVVGESINAEKAFENLPESAFEKYVTEIGDKADKARESATAAAKSEENAKASEANAKNSADASADSERAASQAVDDAKKYAELTEQNANKAGWIRTYYDSDDYLMMEKSESLSALDLRYDDDDNLEVVMN